MFDAGVKETLCTRCAHREVCIYKQDYLETIMQMNVDKLKARYPDGFDAEHSLHRNQDDI